MNSPTQQKRKAAKGTVQIKLSNERLQLVFSWEKQRYYLSLGVPDSPVNRKAAEAKARQIELDFVSGHFDPTLAKYKPQTSLKPSPPAVTPKITPNLKEIWAQYFDYLIPNASPKTINGTYEPVTAHLLQCPTDGLQDPLKFRMELLRATTESQARRSLMQLSAACKWGKKYGLIDHNPLDGMYKDLEATDPDPPMAFSVEERDRIITTFENHKRKGISYQHYAPFVKFLFWTGCRPCEAIGLRWGSIVPDCSKVHFHESIVEVSGRQVRRSETKTGVRRWFSCTPKLQTLLQSIQRSGLKPDTLVFPAPRGGAIRANNFSDRAWETILTSLELQEKDGIKMTPYNCRDTFITLQALQGKSSTTIARWVGNSSKVIEERYLDKLKLEHLRPDEI